MVSPAVSSYKATGATSNMTHSSEPIFLNHLLSSLSPKGRERFLANMRRVELGAEQVLYAAGERIADIYFPENCVLAMLTVMKNGQSVESATVGREGASWVSASFKSPTMPCQTMTVIAGAAYKIPTAAVEQEIRDNVDFHNVLSHYSHMLLVQTLRSGACNGLHSITQRCSRWMLMTLDRTELQRVAITHEFLASLLGVRRATVSELVEGLASEGILEISRGSIRILDRTKLEQLSCECYALIKAQYAQ
jgi:CRP-like cAMP-binding protein